MLLLFLKVENAQLLWEKLMMAFVRQLEVCGSLPVRDIGECLPLERWEELWLGMQMGVVGYSVGGRWLKVLYVKRRKP